MRKIGYFTDFVNVLIITLCGFAVVGGIFKAGLLIMFDHPIHFVEMHYLTKNFIPIHHWVDGWCMAAPPGQPMLLYTYQLGGWIIAALNLLLHIDLNIAYKALVFISYIFAPISLYIFMARKFGRFAGLFSALIFMFQKLHTDLLLGSVWNSYFVIGIFIIFFDILERRYKELDVKSVALLSILQGLLILGHPIAHQASFLLLASFFLMALSAGESAPRRRNLLYMALIPVAGSLIAFFYIYNLLVTRTWLFGNVEPWLKGPFISNICTMAKAIFGGFENYPGMTAVFANLPEFLRSTAGVAGIVLFLRRWNAQTKDLLRVTLIFMAFVFVVFSGIWHYIPVLNTVPLLKTMINKRLLVYLHLGLCIFSAYSIGYIIEKTRARRTLYKVVTILVSITLIFFVALAAHHAVEYKGMTSTTESVKGVKDIKDLWAWLNSNIDGRSRIVVQSTFENIDDPVLRQSHILALGMYYTPFMHIVACGVGEHYPSYQFIETSRGMFFGVPLEKISDAGIVERMRTFNAGYVVSLEPRLEGRISVINGFKEVKRINNFTIFEYSNPEPGWAYFVKHDPGNRYATEIFKDDQIKLKVSNQSPDNEMIVKVAYHPYWRGWVNGMPVGVDSGPFGLMHIKLPDRGESLVELKYNSKKTLPIFVSLTSLTACLYFALFTKRII